VTGEKQDNNINTKKQKHPKTSCWQWRRRPKTPDGGACRTRVVTGTTQTKIRHRRTGCHCARPKKSRAWPSRAPRNIKLLGPWKPRADHRRPTRSELAATGAEDGRERCWGARVNQMSAEKCRSGFQNQRKNSEKTDKKSSCRRHVG
jgi:hypothetical protein